jgi:hypothetical protein
MAMLLHQPTRAGGDGLGDALMGNWCESVHPQQWQTEFFCQRGFKHYDMRRADNGKDTISSSHSIPKQML